MKVPKSCQKVAEKLLNFQNVAEKLPKFFCFSYLFWVLKIKNSHIASYQNFICQSPMIISEVLSISDYLGPHLQIHLSWMYWNHCNCSPSKKQVQRDTADLVIRRHKYQLMGGWGGP